MRKLALAVATVIAVTAATVSTAFADEPTPAPAASTPLQVRPQKPLNLAPTNEGTPFGYKLLAGGVVVVAAGLWLKKKRGGLTSSKTKKRSSIDVLGRTSIGVRNELLVVDVEGTRLLVGMTPGSMQTLAVLQTPEGVVGEESPLMGEEAYMREDAEEEVEELSDRVRSLLEARKKKAALAPAPLAPPAPAESRPVMTAPRRVQQPRARVPGQAKGLLLSLQESVDDRSVTKLGDW
ncbi:MAG: flagellar biosynthetic protein FliO [Labilithrix sp.]|nr:flagellar biosynthetic protein FliO [Labilithrix sp.]MCW5817160.1 flagellar biosynthetic protein FliO [Labilithrix sp.]